MSDTPKIAGYLVSSGLEVEDSHMADIHRESSVIFRLSTANHDRLRGEAAAAGITVQALLELRVLGQIHNTRPGRAPKHRQQEPLIA